MNVYLVGAGMHAYMATYLMYIRIIVIAERNPSLHQKIEYFLSL